MDFSLYVMVIVALAIFAVGLMGGYMLALFLQRKSSGGKLASELKAELDDYRSQVTEHFSRTSAMFQTLTQQYRALYDHLAVGAQDLCAPEPETPRLDIPHQGRLVDRPAGAVNAADAAPAVAVAEPEDATALGPADFPKKSVERP